MIVKPFLDKMDVIQVSHFAHSEVDDYGRIGADGAYLVMELLRGSTWRAELNRRGCIEPAVATEWFDQVLGGLAAAHQAGVVHRDLKPETSCSPAPPKAAPC